MGLKLSDLVKAAGDAAAKVQQWGGDLADSFSGAAASAPALVPIRLRPQVPRPR